MSKKKPKRMKCEATGHRYIERPGDYYPAKGNCDWCGGYVPHVDIYKLRSWLRSLASRGGTVGGTT